MSIPSLGPGAGHGENPRLRAVRLQGRREVRVPDATRVKNRQSLRGRRWVWKRRPEGRKVRRKRRWEGYAPARTARCRRAVLTNMPEAPDPSGAEGLEPTGVVNPPREDIPPNCRKLLS